MLSCGRGFEPLIEWQRFSFLHFIFTNFLFYFHNFYFLSFIYFKFPKDLCLRYDHTTSALTGSSPGATTVGLKLSYAGISEMNWPYGFDSEHPVQDVYSKNKPKTKIIMRLTGMELTNGGVKLKDGRTKLGGWVRQICARCSYVE